jgi:RNA polymerase sigma-70 factor (ECF subfamily)
MAIRALKPTDAPVELDAETLGRAQQGDRGARRALVERYERPVFALVSRLLRAEPAGWEDIAQETFLRVFRELPRFVHTGQARLSTWILTIATRLSIDRLRKERSRSMFEADPRPAGSLEPPPPDLAGALRRSIEALRPISAPHACFGRPTAFRTRRSLERWRLTKAPPARGFRGHGLR